MFLLTSWWAIGHRIYQSYICIYNISYIYHPVIEHGNYNILQLLFFSGGFNMFWYVLILHGINFRWDLPLPLNVVRAKSSTPRYIRMAPMVQNQPMTCFGGSASRPVFHHCPTDNSTKMYQLPRLKFLIGRYPELYFVMLSLWYSHMLLY